MVDIPLEKWTPDVYKLNTGLPSEVKGFLPGPNFKQPWPSLLPYAMDGTAATITAISKADPAVVTYSGADIFTEHGTTLIAGGDMTELSGVFVVNNIDTAQPWPLRCYLRPQGRWLG